MLCLVTDKMSSTTCGSSFHKINASGDHCLDQIEAFLSEYETPSKPPLSKTGLTYTDSDLLNVLGSDNSEKSKLAMSTQSKKPSVPTCPVPPKKRKVPGLSSGPVAKKTLKVLLEKSPARKQRGRPRKYEKASRRTYAGPTFFTCHRLAPPKIRKVEPTHHVSGKHKAKVSTVTCQCDSVTVKNVVVKKEIVDLTGDEDFLCAFLKFAKVNSVEVGVAQGFGATPAKAQVVDVGHQMDKASVFVPDVRFNVDHAVVDLTETDDPGGDGLVVASEKECANRIVPILYKCHKVYQVNRKMEEALREIRQYLPMDESKDDLYPYKIFSQSMKRLGFDLVQELSGIRVKSLNFSRFIEIVASKLNLSFGLGVSPQIILWYLRVLLDQHERTCKVRLVAEILEGVDNYNRAKRMKREIYESEVVFTDDQLRQLRSQIGKYIEIAVRQEKLMAAYGRADETGLSALTKEIKTEMLTLQGERLQHVKIENEIVCILDDD